jgi:hypothetical protein
MKIHENPKVLNAVAGATIIILFAAFALKYLSVPLWDYDFWWHIATGKYIVTSGVLPANDPFSFTTILAENKNPFPEWENFVLKQYWFGQVILFSIFDYFGAQGIVVFRSLMLLTTLAVVYLILKRWSVSLPVSFIFIFTIFTASLKNTGERPVLFTILFTALTFFLLEDFSKNKKKHILLLAPLMLLWSNVHGGYIIGVMVIIAFMAGEGIDIFLKKTAYTKKEIYLLYSALSLSILVSCINPTGWQAILIAANIPFKYKAIHDNIQEYFSPFYLYKHKIYPVDYEYIFLVLLFPVIVLLRNKKMRLSHLMILTVFFLMSLSAKRMVIYYAILGSLIMARETDLLITGLRVRHLPEVRYKKLATVLVVACFASAVFYFSGNMYKTGFMVSNSISAPVGAADFIEDNKLSGNMFNDFAYGGYFAWRFYPGQKTFIDTRGLNINVRQEYGWIRSAEEIDMSDDNDVITRRQLWELLLNHYKINFVLLTVVNPFYQMHPLILKLAESDQWVPVYSDNRDVIFVRDDIGNKQIIEKYRLSAEAVYNTIIYQSARNALRNKTNPISLVSLGDMFYKMKRLEEARKAYAYALSRIPESPVIKQKIKQVEADIQQGERSK